MNSNFIYKYKPYSVKDTHIHENTKSTINNFIQRNNINIIIYGPSNSGKTTLINSILYDYFGVTQDKHLPKKDILYINSLKEQGISYYRNELKTFCKSYSSTKHKKIVYIDDLDTVNEQYQQIFRSYIDKYYNNVQFICSCSVIQKIIVSLQSRLTTIKIPPFSYNINRGIIKNIIDKECIKIDEECIEYLLKTSNNCIRTVINNIEKIYLYENTVNLEVCKKLCFHICVQHFDSYINNINRDNIEPSIEMLHYLYDLGYSVIDILEMFLKYIKISTIINETHIYKTIILISKYIVTLNKIHENKIELTLFTHDLKNILYK